MFTLFWWVVIILPVLFRPQTSPYLSSLEIMAVITFLGIELVIFFDLPGSKILKNSNQFTLKTTTLSKIISENEKKIKNIRFAIFILTMAVILILTMTKCSGIICLSYIIFLFCTNLDIALVLASPEERKTYWKDSIVRNLKGALVGVVVLICIMAAYIYHSKQELDKSLNTLQSNQNVIIIPAS